MLGVQGEKWFLWSKLHEITLKNNFCSLDAFRFSHFSDILIQIIYYRVGFNNLKANFSNHSLRADTHISKWAWQ